MANENLTAKKTVIGGDDSIVVKKYIAGYEGGRTLDLTAWGADKPVKCGHVILQKKDGTFVPAPIKGETYEALTADYHVAGILYGNVTPPRQAASIMTWGIVNKALLPYKLTEEMVTALPHVSFVSDADETWT